VDDAVKEVLARVGQLSLAGDLPTDRAGLWALLRSEGFEERALRAGLGEAPEPTPHTQTPPAPVLRLTDEATAFLNGLRDLGYLDDDLEDEALDAVMAESTSPVVLDQVRRAVAMVLFERQYDLEPETLRFLEEEWRLAFH
jgi:hypothetical protein